MTTKAEVNRALDRVAKGDTLDASDLSLCRDVMLASFMRFSDQIAPNAPSSAQGLNSVAVLRHKCALGESELIEPIWIAARCVGIGRGDAIVVDTVHAATMVAGAGGIPKKASQNACGYILTDLPANTDLTLPENARAALIRDYDAEPRDDAIKGGGRIATITLTGAICIDVYEQGQKHAPDMIDIERINKTAGQALDAISPRNDTVRRKLKSANGRAEPIAYVYPGRQGENSINDIYDGYIPEVALCKIAKPHPAPLIQSKTLAGSRPVPQSYRPVLNPEILIKGAISDTQFETIVLAGESHSKILDFDLALGGEPRLGFLLADGTGAGKSNTGIGIILDNWNQGRRRHIIIAEKQRHREAYVRAMTMLGMSTDNLITLDSYKPNATLPKRDGILFLTYALLRSVDQNNRFVRSKQIVDWAGTDFQGVLLMDESQNMRNGTMASSTNTWSSAASLQAMSGIELQNSLLGARVVYSSATGSTVLENLNYMVRLGLWGPGTPYNTSDAFYQGLEESGLSGLEAISSHIKANGQMVCRQLSLAGVAYEELIHPMSPHDIRLYDEYCGMLMEVARLAQYCAQNAVRVNTRDRDKSVSWRNLRSNGDGPFYSAVFASLSKRLVDTLIVSIKCQSLIHDMESALDRGEACVVQIQNTFEAELNRMMERGDGVDTEQLQATSELVRFVASLPEVQLDRRGQPITDRHDETTPIPENREAKRSMIERIMTLPGFVRPLEHIFSKFGHARIAEITGRSNRVVPVNPLGQQGDANAPLQIQARTATDVTADHRAFMNDQKQILIFSNDAGGTGMDYHASLHARNQRLRRHYVLQLGYRADQAIQGPGRSHRTHQRQPPVICYVSLDIPAEKVYLSGVVSRMASLGALSQGHRQASSNRMFSALDTYRSSHAESGWAVFAAKLRAGQYPELTEEKLTAVGSFETNNKYQSLISITQFLKRAVSLPIATQRATFQHLDFEIQNHIMGLISTGRYDSGPEVMRDPVRVLSEEVLYTHPRTKARILISRVECDVTANLSSFQDVITNARMFTPAGIEPEVWFNETTADVWVEYPIADAANGFEMVCVMRADTECYAPRFTMRGRRIDRIDDHTRAEMLWTAQIERIAQHRTKNRTLISGALPLIWTMLRSGNSHRRLMIAKTVDDNRILGFATYDQEIDEVRIRLSQMDMANRFDIDKIYDEFRAGLTINLKNGMIITPQNVLMSTRQALNVADADIPQMRKNASAIGLDVIRRDALEYFAFPLNEKLQERALRNLITVYGYADTTPHADWSRLQ